MNPQRKQPNFILNSANILPPPPPPPPPLTNQKNPSKNKPEFTTPQAQSSTLTKILDKSKTDKPSRDLKSSMKRLFSPNHTPTPTQTPSSTKTSIRTTQQQQQCTITNLNDLINQTNNNKSLENLSTISTTSSNTSSSIATASSTSTNTSSIRGTNSLKLKTINKPINNKNIDSTKKPISQFDQQKKLAINKPPSVSIAQSPRSTTTTTTTSSLKNKLNLFKNTKKLPTTTATSNTPSTTSLQSTSPIFTLPPPPPPPPSSITSSPPSSSQDNYEINEQKFIKDLQTQVDYLKKQQYLDTNTQMKIKELNYEIERLSRLYDFEVSKQNKYEEKIQVFKQMAEEKQIESAALKYEYRKMQELKDNLVAENTYLKSYILHPQVVVGTVNSSSTNASPSPKNVSSPRGNNNNNNNGGLTLTPSSTSSSNNRNIVTQSPRNSTTLSNQQFNQGIVAFFFTYFLLT
jgi:hypothetical protein